ncbi:5269_t:CDS:2 [Paraglomus brasilianum]|uniref:5269_t:CDS:1 n=1 Tax=Paraglomus brasilianum TaxID=144538 RepID=A0A9N9D2J8_9GLOM|nr:5269_t:CDS:2 [Paraglomus brasilianum]
MSASEEPLPPGWDARYNRNYFVDTKTGVPQWVDPRKHSNVSHRSSASSSTVSSGSGTPVMHNQPIPARTGSPVGHMETSPISNGAPGNMNVNISQICAQTESLSIADSRVSQAMPQSAQVSTTNYQSYNALVTPENLNRQATPGFNIQAQTLNQKTAVTSQQMTMPLQTTSQPMTNPSLTMPQQTTIPPQQSTNSPLTMPHAHTGGRAHSESSSPDSVHAALGWQNPQRTSTQPVPESMRPALNRHSTTPANLNSTLNKTQQPPPVPTTNVNAAQPVAAYPVKQNPAIPGGIVSPNIPGAPATGQTQYILRTDANGKKYYVPVQVQSAAVNKNPQAVNVQAVPAGQPVVMNGKLVYLQQGQQVQQLQPAIYNQSQYNQAPSVFQQKLLSVGKEVGKAAARLAAYIVSPGVATAPAAGRTQANPQPAKQKPKQQQSGMATTILTNQSDDSGGFNLGDMMQNFGDMAQDLDLGDMASNIGDMFSGDD